jgi:Flp pilus assembly protein TadG
MSRPTTTRRVRRLRGEKGYILAMTGLLLVPLVVFTAFGVDLGAWYAQAAKEQRAVDAASLAGVVQLPDQTAAATAARTSLIANGYVFTSAQCTVSATLTPANSSNKCVFSFPSAAGQEMYVSLYQPATQYFSGVALGSESLTRQATAVYNLHIPLGSPNFFFGNNLPNGCTSLTSTTGACTGNPVPQPNLFAAIQGPYSRHQDGDPYATMCSGDTQTPSTCNPALATGQTGGPPTYAEPGVTPGYAAVQNTGYHKNGYLWAVDVKQAGTVTVQIYDPANGGTGAPLYETLSSTATYGRFNTSYELFQASGSSATLYTDPAHSMSQAGACSAGPGWQNFQDGTGAAFYTEAWYTLCTFTAPGPGIYPLEVKTSDITNPITNTGIADSGAGWNVYSVRATVSSGTPPQVYALDSMSIWTAAPGTTANFYLANIGPQYAGHTLQIYLYDPGDGSGPDAFTMQFLEPPSGLGTVPTGGTPISCNYNSTPSPTQVAPSTPTVSANCTVTTKLAGSSSGVYNGNWLNLVIQIPSSYSCSTDCWWWVKYNLGTSGSAPNDRTTWAVNVLGDPVHLIN